MVNIERVARMQKLKNLLSELAKEPILIKRNSYLYQIKTQDLITLFTLLDTNDSQQANEYIEKLVGFADTNFSIINGLEKVGQCILDELFTSQCFGYIKDSTEYKLVNENNSRYYVYKVTHENKKSIIENIGTFTYRTYALSYIDLKSKTAS